MSATIYALASGAGRAGVAVIRISGPDAGAALSALSGKPLPPPREARLVRLSDPVGGELLDTGLALHFPAPGSYTGEDVVELQIHGGPGVIAAVLDALGRLPGLRLAEPGEFTRRAVLAGKMDLTAAEGLLDLIEADTEAQRRQALRQAGGALRTLYDGWRARLVSGLAHLEAAIDFPDEDLPDSLDKKFRAEMEKLSAEMASHLDDGRQGRAASAGADGRDRGAAQRREIEPVESAGAARGGDRLGPGGDDPGRGGGLAGPGRISGAGGGYRRSARGGGRD